MCDEKEKRHPEFVGWDSIIKGWIEMKDTLRFNAKEVIQALHERGIETVLLSGDSIAVTKSIAETVQMRQYFGELLPKDKIEKIETLKKSGTTIMVGDGINDAPSLAASDVGITLASATDIAKESAHVTIVGDHLDKIPWIIDYAKKTLKVIRWNLFWAFGYNGIRIVLAAAGLLQPVIAALAMIISSLVIIVTSRRLRE